METGNAEACVERPLRVEKPTVFIDSDPYSAPIALLLRVSEYPEVSPGP